MTEKRENKRISFISTGVVDCKNRETVCRIENISERGALVCMSDPAPETLHQGDIVHLKTILLAPIEFQCTIKRIDERRIAVQFLDHK